jgi:hypothetical protein
MRVYLNNTKGYKQALHLMSVAPAKDHAFTKGTEVPVEWVDENNKPVNIEIKFLFGVAEVPDPLGRYLLARSLGLKTRLRTPRELEYADD